MLHKVISYSKCFQYSILVLMAYVPHLQPLSDAIKLCWPNKVSLRNRYLQAAKLHSSIHGLPPPKKLFNPFLCCPSAEYSVGSPNSDLLIFFHTIVCICIESSLRATPMKRPKMSSKRSTAAASKREKFMNTFSIFRNGCGLRQMESEESRGVMIPALALDPRSDFKRVRINHE